MEMQGDWISKLSCSGRRTFTTGRWIIYRKPFQKSNVFGAIKNMQLYQDGAGEVMVRIDATDKSSKEDASEIKGKIEQAVGGRLKAQVKIVDKIKRTPSGKYKFLEQKLHLIYGEYS